jgi:PTS system nitrogen regulatory IIA component
MKLTDIITLDCTLCAVQTSSKKRVLELICEQATKVIDQFTTYTLLDSLLIREKMGSTGIGNGIAIPHGRLAGSKQVVAVIATCNNPIEFDAIDNRPVDIFIALFVPEENCQAHLKTLQNIAELFSEKNFCRQVRKCQTSLELFQLIKQSN